MTALASFKRFLPDCVYRVGRRTALCALGSIVGAEVGTAPVVSLTFDDGPGPATPTILETLERYQARATFFLIGRHVDASPEMTKAIVRAGHEVGNHTFSHRRLPTLTRADRLREIRDGHDAISRASGVVPRFLRPPFGIQSMATYVDARRAGYEIIGWSLHGHDWDGDPAETIAARIADAVAPGDIALLHDAVDLPDDPPSSDRRVTVAALALVLEQLRARGLRSVTVSELLTAGPSRRKLWFWPGSPADPQSSERY